MTSPVFAGDPIPADVVNRAIQKPFCHIQQTGSAQTLTTGTTTLVTLNSAIEDTDGMADTASSRMVVQTSGLYRVTYQVAFVTSTVGARHAYLRRAGGIIASVGGPGQNSFTRLCGSFTARFTAGQTIDMQTSQSSGGNLSMELTYGGSFIQAEWISIIPA